VPDDDEIIALLRQIQTDARTGLAAVQAGVTDVQAGVTDVRADLQAIQAGLKDILATMRDTLAEQRAMFVPKLPGMIIVCAVWDPEARVWIAESSDLPGLVTEAETVEALRAKIPAMMRDLRP
jgi:hypothetical protein